MPYDFMKCTHRERLESFSRTLAQLRKEDETCRMPPPAPPLNSNGKRNAPSIEDVPSRHTVVASSGDTHPVLSCDTAPRTPSRIRVAHEIPAVITVGSPRGCIAGVAAQFGGSPVHHHEENALGQQVGFITLSHQPLDHPRKFHALFTKSIAAEVLR